MKALLFEQANKPLKLEEIDDPVPDRGEILLNMQCAALNHRDVWITKGLYPNLQSGVVLGSDGVGIYKNDAWLVNPNISWGSDIQLPRDDYQILGMPEHGTFREKMAISRERLIRMPDHLTLEQGAALPLAGLTAYRVLFTRCQLKAGERVCISGIGGGVALFALQFALAAGAQVWVTSSSQAKIDRAIEIGATGGVLYNEDKWSKRLVKESRGFDVVVDSAGGAGFGALVSTCNKGGRVGIYGGSAGKISSLSPQIVFWKHVSILGSSMGSDQDFEAMVDFVQQQKIVPIVDTVFEFDEYPKALARMEAGTQFGKIVFRIG